jgi:hypothetical protein
MDYSLGIVSSIRRARHRAAIAIGAKLRRPFVRRILTNMMVVMKATTTRLIMIMVVRLWLVVLLLVLLV